VLGASVGEGLGEGLVEALAVTDAVGLGDGEVSAFGTTLLFLWQPETASAAAHRNAHARETGRRVKRHETSQRTLECGLDSGARRSLAPSPRHGWRTHR
jgi:hypothetical protein